MAGIFRGEWNTKCPYTRMIFCCLFLTILYPPPVLTLLSEFGQISGYKLNLTKSELMPINKAASEIPLSSMPFKASLHSFKYLGVHVTKCFANLFHHNFSPLLSRLTKDFHRWSLLPLSLVGRMNCVKMNVLPKFLYLFQSIPIFIPKSFFVTLDSSISQFIWNGKTPKIRKSILQKPRHLRGLALPNFVLLLGSEHTVHATLE